MGTVNDEFFLSIAHPIKSRRKVEVRKEVRKVVAKGALPKCRGNFK